MDANSIIEKLGGTVAAAKFFEVKPPSVSEWRRNGIPRARMMYLRAMRPDIVADERPIDKSPAQATA